MITILKGFLIGLANIIPGVSGGTLALILGIYKRTIAALHGVDAALVRALLGVLSFRPGAWPKLRAELRRVDAAFLGLLGFGAIVAIASTSKLMAYLLEKQHAPSYAFFFGLVMVSIIFPYRYLTRRSFREVISFIVAAGLTVSLTLMADEDQMVRKAEAKQSLEQSEVAQVEDAESGQGAVSLAFPGAGPLVKVFLAAVLAISAMVLPGISGSFILLLLGVYFDILIAINERQVFVLATFALGCGVGLLVFARVMNVLLEKAYNITMAFMIGLMAGSLWVLWPFKKVVMAGDLTLYVSNILPSGLGGEVWISVIAWAAGCGIILVFVALDKGEKAVSC